MCSSEVATKMGLFVNATSWLMVGLIPAMACQPTWSPCRIVGQEQNCIPRKRGIRERGDLQNITAIVMNCRIKSSAIQLCPSLISHKHLPRTSSVVINSAPIPSQASHIYLPSTYLRWWFCTMKISIRLNIVSGRPAGGHLMDECIISLT